MAKFDLDSEAIRIVDFIKSEIKAAGVENAVVGLSGGIDSALASALCAKALGPEHVFGFMMPTYTSSKESLADARKAAKLLGIKTEKIPIGKAVGAISSACDVEDFKRLGNIAARVRMTVLYDRSARHCALVCGTGNRTESLLGYTTLHGDSACGFAPIAHLYKHEVRALAKHLGVPKSILEKKPTADLWRGQTDEGEMGFSYDDADAILSRMYDKNMTDAAIAKDGFDIKLVRRVRQMSEKSEFKRRMPHSLKRMR